MTRTWVGALLALGVAAGRPTVGAAQSGDRPAFGTAIRSRLAAGRLPTLRWADLADVAVPADSAYRRAGWQPLWLRDGRPAEAALALLAEIGRVAERGLTPGDFDADELTALAARLSAGGGGAEDTEAFDLGLTAATIRLAGALHFGRADVRTAAPGWRLGAEPADLAPVIDSLRRGAAAAGILDRLEPQDPVYQGLKRWLTRYRALAAGPASPPFPLPTSSVKPGGRYPAAARLRERLAMLGDLGAGAAGAADSIYDGPTAEGVRRFQRRHGLLDDGALGRETVARLNEPLARRVRQIELALERRRWWPPAAGWPAIVVNVPAFRLTAAGLDSTIAMKVIAGEARKNETPVFTARLGEVIFLPSWEVPVSIMRKEIRPKALKNPNYLEAEGMELLDGERVVPATGQNVSRIGQDVRVRQRPGPKNALGHVKFLLASGYAVHLHDTPTPKLFGAARRDFSHGCIRVSEPVALARFVLSQVPGWTDERIMTAMAGDTSVTVVLPHPISVAVTYETAVLMGDQIEFRADIYGRDRRLERLLAGGFPNRAGSR